MEPFARASVVIASHHLAKADFITVAVSGLSLLVFVVALVKRFIVRGDDRWRGWSRFLRISLRRWVCTSCRS
jgi:hypothetical protein